jgi:hypothetical protein
MEIYQEVLTVNKREEKHNYIGEVLSDDGPINEKIIKLQKRFKKDVADNILDFNIVYTSHLMKMYVNSLLKDPGCADHDHIVFAAQNPLKALATLIFGFVAFMDDKENIVPAMNIMMLLPILMINSELTDKEIISIVNTINKKSKFQIEDILRAVVTSINLLSIANTPENELVDLKKQEAVIH